MQSQHPYHSFGRNPQEELKKYTVQVSRVGEEAALGTGILVTNDGLIATCYHVIKSIIKSKSAGSSNKKYVDVSFSDGGIKLQAEILEPQYCKENLDVAILKIDRIPSGYEEAKLGIRIYDYFGHRFVSRGYRKNERYSHLPSNGTISDIVYSKDWSSEVIRLESTNYGETGMSGSAVYDVDVRYGLVVGMMRFHDEDEVGVDDKAPYAIPVSDIMKTCPEIQNKNRGLLLYEFLNMIESFDSESYKDVDYLWVPPKEYDEIIRTLNKDRVVIIIGPPEYGKTYTAIRILLEYYHKGYITKLVEIEDTSVEKTVFKKKVDEILNVASQKKNIIVYLNDPFGRTKFVEDYVDEVKALLNKLKVYKNGRLIITSRESNYRQINDSLFENIESVVKFDIARPSYSSEKRERILQLHAKNSSCEWIKNKQITKRILSSLKRDPRNLPTLLNILNFAQQTIDEDDVDNLEKKMEELSDETPRVFAKEIKAEHYDLMEFLSFPFISENLTTELVRSLYEALIEDDKKDIKSYSFEHIATKFKDKISTEEYVKFRHPSYSEALPFLLERKHDTAQDRQKPDPIIDGFSKVIFKLHDNKYTDDLVRYSAAQGLTSIIAENFGDLPPRVQNLLLKTADDNNTALYVAVALDNNFDNLPPEIRNQLLLKLSDNKGKETARKIADVVARNFDELPGTLTKELMFKLFYNDAAVHIAYSIARIIAENFDNLYPNVQNLIFKLADYETAAVDVARAVAENYDNVPKDWADQLLIKLADNKTATLQLIDLLAENLFRLPKDLLIRIAQKKTLLDELQFHTAVIDSLHRNSARLLIYWLISYKAATPYLALLVSDLSHDEHLEKNFRELPDDIRNNLLQNLADYSYQCNRYIEAISILTMFNRDIIPLTVRREVIIRLAHCKDAVIQGAANHLSYELTELFDEVPVSVRNSLLPRLIQFENTNNRDGVIIDKHVARIVYYNFNKLPEGLRSDLLLQLIDCIRRHLIHEDYDDHPDSFANLVGYVSFTICQSHSEMPPEIQIVLFLLADKSYAAIPVMGLVENCFDELPDKLREQLLLKLADREESASRVANVISVNFDKLTPEIREELVSKLNKMDIHV